MRRGRRRRAAPIEPVADSLFPRTPTLRRGTATRCSRQSRTEQRKYYALRGEQEDDAETRTQMDLRMPRSSADLVLCAPLLLLCFACCCTSQREMGQGVLRHRQRLQFRRASGSAVQSDVRAVGSSEGDEQGQDAQGHRGGGRAQGRRQTGADGHGRPAAEGARKEDRVRRGHVGRAEDRRGQGPAVGRTAQSGKHMLHGLHAAVHARGAGAQASAHQVSATSDTQCCCIRFVVESRSSLFLLPASVSLACAANPTACSLSITTRTLPS